MELKDLTSWLLIGGGWVIVHYLAFKRDMHKIRIEQGLKLITRIQEIEKAAIAYHTSTQRNQLDEAQITSDLKELSGDLKIIAYSGSTFAINLANFRKAIMLSNFASNDFVKQPENSQILQDIKTHGLGVRLTIKTEISKRLDISFWDSFYPTKA